MDIIFSFELSQNDVVLESYSEAYGTPEKNRRIKQLSFNHKRFAGSFALSMVFIDSSDAFNVNYGMDFVLKLGKFRIFSGVVTNYNTSKVEAPSRNHDEISISVSGSFHPANAVKFSLFKDETQAKETFNIATLLNDVMLGGQFPSAYQPPTGFNYHIAGETGVVPSISFNASLNNEIEAGDNVQITRSYDQVDVHTIWRQVKDFANGQRVIDSLSRQYVYGVGLDGVFFFKLSREASSPLMELRMGTYISSHNIDVDISAFKPNVTESNMTNELVVDNEILSLPGSGSVPGDPEYIRQQHVATYGPKRQTLNNKSLNMDIQTAEDWYAGFGLDLLGELKTYTVPLNTNAFKENPPFFNRIDGNIDIYNEDKTLLKYSEPLMEMRYVLNRSGYLDPTMVIGTSRPSLQVRADVLVQGDNDAPVVSFLNQRQTAYDKTYQKVKNPMYVACTAVDDASVVSVDFYVSKLQEVIEGPALGSSTKNNVYASIFDGAGVDDFVDYELEIYGGTGINQLRTVESSGDGFVTFTVDPLDVAPDATSDIRVTRWSDPLDTSNDFLKIGEGALIPAGLKGNTSEFYEYTNSDNQTGTIDSATNVTLIDAALIQTANDYWAGHVVEITSGDADGDKRIITDFDPALDKLTVEAFSQVPSAGDTYEIYSNNGFFDLETQAGMSVNDIFRIKIIATDTSGNLGESINEFQFSTELPSLQLSVIQDTTGTNDQQKPDLVRVSFDKFNVRIKTEDATVDEISLQYHDGSEVKSFTLSGNTVIPVSGESGVYELNVDQDQPNDDKLHKIKVITTNIFGGQRTTFLYIAREQDQTDAVPGAGPTVAISPADEESLDEDMPTYNKTNNIIASFTFQEDLVTVSSAVFLTSSGPYSASYDEDEKQYSRNFSWTNFGASMPWIRSKVTGTRFYINENGNEDTKSFVILGPKQRFKWAETTITERMPDAEQQLKAPWVDQFENPQEGDLQLFTDTTAPDAGDAGFFFRMRSTDGWQRVGLEPGGTPSYTWTVNNDDDSEEDVSLIFKNGDDLKMGILRYRKSTQTLSFSSDGPSGPFDPISTGGAIEELFREISSVDYKLSIEAVTGDIVYKKDSTEVFRITKTGELKITSDIVPTDDLDYSLGYAEQRFAEAHTNALYVEDIHFTANGIDTVEGFLFDSGEGKIVPTSNVLNGFWED